MTSQRNPKQHSEKNEITSNTLAETLNWHPKETLNGCFRGYRDGQGCFSFTSSGRTNPSVWTMQNDRFQFQTVEKQGEWYQKTKPRPKKKYSTPFLFTFWKPISYHVMIELVFQKLESAMGWIGWCNGLCRDGDHNPKNHWWFLCRHGDVWEDPRDSGLASYIWVNYNDLTALPHWNHG